MLTDKGSLPVGSTRLSQPKSTAIDLIRNILLLAEFGLLQAESFADELGSALGVERDMDQDGNYVPTTPDEVKKKPTTMSTEDLLEVEALIQHSFQPQASWVNVHSIYRYSLLFCLRTLLSEQNTSLESFHLDTLFAPTALPHTSVYNDEMRRVKGLFDFVHKHKGHNIQHSISELFPGELESWQQLLPLKDRLVVTNAAARVSTRTGGKGAADEDQEQKFFARLSFAAFTLVRLRAHLRLRTAQNCYLRTVPGQVLAQQWLPHHATGHKDSLELLKGIKMLSSSLTSSSLEVDPKVAAFAARISEGLLDADTQLRARTDALRWIVTPIPL